MSLSPRAAAGTVAALLLAGCAGPEPARDDRCARADSFSGEIRRAPNSADPTPSESPTSAPVPSPSVIPRDRWVGPPIRETARLVSVSLGDAKGVTEVRYGFDGVGTLGWSAAFVSGPIVKGGGTVTVAGRCLLQVTFSGSRPPALPAGARHLDGGPGAVAEVVTVGLDDGIAQSFIGVRPGRPVLEITGPGAGALVVRLTPS